LDVEKRKADNMFAEPFTIAQDIALYIALYAAGLSTLLGLVRLLLDRRIRIKVKVTPGLTEPDINKVVVINAANVGMRGTSLGSAYLELPRQKRLFLPIGPYQQRTAPNPYEMTPGSPELTISFDNKEIAETLKKEGYSGKIPFRALVDGVGGKQYKSKKKLINANTGFVINKSARLKWLYWSLKRTGADKRP
jgi:hypothetical protein